MKSSSQPSHLWRPLPQWLDEILNIPLDTEESGPLLQQLLVEMCRLQRYASRIHARWYEADATGMRIALKRFKKIAVGLYKLSNETGCKLTTGEKSEMRHAYHALINAWADLMWAPDVSPSLRRDYHKGLRQFCKVNNQKCPSLERNKFLDAGMPEAVRTELKLNFSVTNIIYKNVIHATSDCKKEAVKILTECHGQLYSKRLKRIMKLIILGFPIAESLNFALENFDHLFAEQTDEAWLIFMQLLLEEGKMKKTEVRNWEMFAPIADRIIKVHDNVCRFDQSEDGSFPPYEYLAMLEQFAKNSCKSFNVDSDPDQHFPKFLQAALERISTKAKEELFHILNARSDYDVLKSYISIIIYDLFEHSSPAELIEFTARVSNFLDLEQKQLFRKLFEKHQMCHTISKYYNSKNLKDFQHILNAIFLFSLDEQLAILEEALRCSVFSKLDNAQNQCLLKLVRQLFSQTLIPLITQERDDFKSKSTSIWIQGHIRDFETGILLLEQIVLDYINVLSTFSSRVANTTLLNFLLSVHRHLTRLPERRETRSKFHSERHDPFIHGSSSSVEEAAHSKSERELTKTNDLQLRYDKLRGEIEGLHCFSKSSSSAQTSA